MISVRLDRPWLTATLARAMRCLSWAPHNPGLVRARHILWREVRNADLTRDFDAISWLSTEMQARNSGGDIGMLTSRDIGRYCLEHADSGLTQASCLATVGLGNAERVGHRRPVVPQPCGTVNLLAATDAPLSDVAMFEALSIVTQARTAAILDHGPELKTGRATGTGTDCIVLACPEGDIAHAGLHTEVGEALGRAVYAAVARGVRDWMETEALQGQLETRSG
ncbi:Adenosylcobinamide amidohydrolase [Roseibacterium elongatum DSM 19469]|uniref:Adenosylcobinamide amidohydrolase n=1 Tax=Roseicyclus elongatus DSM 19469 TaxID=1294273 RepID=W8SLM4_9RHOB|nr:adenosylcobinamide amidohydrolase [Roseibacterium elongatum]AHM03405.1 Adenosylcobinamide amidohydrolase [Roseibacterium elongatum DSM 19469]